MSTPNQDQPAQDQQGQEQPTQQQSAQQQPEQEQPAQHQPEREQSTQQQPAQQQRQAQQDKDSRASILHHPTVASMLVISLIGVPALALVVVIILGITGKIPIVHELSNTDAARGLITFIFTMGTMFIALLLAIGALLGDQPEQIFAKGKEVLTVLIGVFGTILGFYFGTTGNAQKIDVAEIRIIEDAKPVQLMTHVTGGTPPYRYSITFSDKNFQAVTDQLSKDGWIIQKLETVPTTGSITVDVSDSRDFKSSRLRRLSPPPIPTPTPKPATSDATTQSPPQQ